MFRLALAPLALLTLTLSLAPQLVAQRYQERDHTVFHRPTPPAKHTGSAGTAGNHSAASATTAAPRAPESNRRHDLTVSAPPPSAGTHSSQTQQLPK